MNYACSSYVVTSSSQDDLRDLCFLWTQVFGLLCYLCCSVKCEVPKSSVYTKDALQQTNHRENVEKIDQSLAIHVVSVTGRTWQEVLCISAAWLQVNSLLSFFFFFFKLISQPLVCNNTVSHITTLTASRRVIQSSRLSHLWGLHQEELCLICSKMTDRRSKKKKNKKQQSSVDYTFDGSLLSCQNEWQSTVTFFFLYCQQFHLRRKEGSGCSTCLWVGWAHLCAGSKQDVLSGFLQTCYSLAPLVV